MQCLATPPPSVVFREVYLALGNRALGSNILDNLSMRDPYAIHCPHTGSRDFWWTSGCGLDHSRAFTAGAQYFS